MGPRAPGTVQQLQLRGRQFQLHWGQLPSSCLLGHLSPPRRPERPVNHREASLHLTRSSASLPFAHPRGSESVHPFVCPPIPSPNHRLNAYSALSVLLGVVLGFTS